jgi:lipoprotein-releasing system permease protein
VGFELFVATRYLLARRRQAFISVISLISTLGVAVGVMALIIALALMTGLQRELRDRILGSTAHVYVWRIGGIQDYRSDVEKLAKVEGVVGAAPMLSEISLVFAQGREEAFTLKGIDTALEPTVTDLGRAMLEGRLSDLDVVPEDGIHGVILGKTLAEKLEVSVGDRVQLITKGSTAWSPGGMMPRYRPARVVGTFSLGLYEFDAAYGFTSLEFAKRLMGRDQPSQIQVKVADIDDAPAVARAVPERLGLEYFAEEWQKTNEPLFSALWLEKMGLSIAIGLIVAVAALNIVASLILLVMEKSRDIAILKTMGLSSQRVMRIFMLQGLIIGLVGTVIGGAGGVLLCWIFDKYQLIHISIDVYQIAYIPFVIRPFDLAVVLASAIVICFVATLYPSRQAARLDPVQALRFE